MMGVIGECETCEHREEFDSWDEVLRKVVSSYDEGSTVKSGDTHGYGT